ncbi:hypothetical protein RDWZM_000120 [Blomia tropicalis]|uniref:Uncharacterized protein n=1 Tax=Blomia tropicalis TaxID=40697 RepID=A0A9Q0RPG9_BLOTA|nr:hypothetical protein RDWZM_000120 [Blomia tropicalis]
MAYPRPPVQDLSQIANMIRNDAWLGECFEKMDYLIQNLSDKCKDQNKAIELLEHKNDGIKGQVEMIEGRLAKMQLKVDGSSESITSIVGRLEKFDEKVALLQKSVDLLNERMLTLQTMLASSDEKINLFQSKVDHFEKGFFPILKKLETFEKKHNEFITNISVFDKRLVVLETKVNSIISSQAKNHANVERRFENPPKFMKISDSNKYKPIKQVYESPINHHEQNINNPSMVPEYANTSHAQNSEKINDLNYDEEEKNRDIQKGKHKTPKTPTEGKKVPSPLMEKQNWKAIVNKMKVIKMVPTSPDSDYDSDIKSDMMDNESKFSAKVSKVKMLKIKEEKNAQLKIKKQGAPF